MHICGTLKPFLSDEQVHKKVLELFCKILKLQRDPIMLTLLTKHKIREPETGPSTQRAHHQRLVPAKIPLITPKEKQEILTYKDDKALAEPVDDPGDEVHQCEDQFVPA